MNELQTTEKLKDSLLSTDKFDHYFKVATELSKSDLAPKNMKGKPMDILLAMEMGYQIGLPLMQSLQAIAVINGKTCMYGDDLLAVVQAHKDYEWIKEEPLLKENTIIGYRCTLKRRGHEAHESIFTLDDAKKANLLGKPGPWQQYQNRMLQVRARGFAVRDVFADALRGIKPAEEVRDYISDAEIIDLNTGEVVKKTNTQKLLDRIKNNKGNLDDEKADEKNNDAIFIAAPSGRKFKNSESAPSYQKNDGSRQEMVINAEQAIVASHSEDASMSITEQQLDAIDCLLHEKKFDVVRVDKALKHFKVKSFAEMTEEQGHELISILEKTE